MTAIVTERLTDKRRVNGYILLFTVVYLVSYVTRINYGAVISEMVRAENLPKSLLSLAVTGSFITYGVGQVISGFIGDRIQPKTLILLGFLTTSAMNLLIPFCRTPYQMAAVWCVNGFAQALMWPPLVRLMTYLFTEEMYKRACVIVSWGSSFGTILVYLVSPLVIQAAGWRYVFFASAACGLLMAAVWQKTCCKLGSTEQLRGAEPAGTPPRRRFFTPVLLMVMLGIILQGSLRDGVTTWMPSYISETYDLSSIVSILTGIILPLFSIACFQLSAAIYRRTLRNPLTCAAVIYSVGAVCAAALLVTTGGSPALSVVFCALLTGCMHGVNLILICMTPAYFAKSGNVSFVSGLLNACTYVGSAISTYGIARVAETRGWNTTIGLWLATAILGGVVCFAAAPVWRRKFPDSNRHTAQSRK